MNSTLLVQQCRWFAGLVRIIVFFPFFFYVNKLFDLQQYMDAYLGCSGVMCSNRSASAGIQCVRDFPLRNINYELRWTQLDAPHLKHNLDIPNFIIWKQKKNLRQEYIVFAGGECSRDADYCCG